MYKKTHYYPFGKTMTGAWYKDAGASTYKYLYNGKKLSDEFNLNFYDYGARWFDPGVGSWWEVDPLSEVSRRWSPYVYGNNNPVRFTDPDGKMTEDEVMSLYRQREISDFGNEASGSLGNTDIELQFNNKGKYIRSVDDGKAEYSGSIINDDGSVEKHFTFNDQNDAKKIAYEKNISIDMNFSNMTEYYLNRAGVKEAKNILLRYPYAGIKSLAGGKMDFVQHLYYHSRTEKTLYMAGNIAYNNYDAGNFLWGLAMRKLGFDYGSVKVGSEVNGFFNSKRQNGQGYGETLSGDSVDDQRAIRKGYFWKLNN